MTDSTASRPTTLALIAAALLAILFPAYVVSYPLYLRWRFGPDVPRERRVLTIPLPFSEIEQDKTTAPIYVPLEMAIARFPWVARGMFWLAKQVGAGDALSDAWGRRLRPRPESLKQPTGR